MTRNRTFRRHLMIILLLTGAVSGVGCKNQGRGQPSNPFAMDRQTAPPPATFSHQQLYMGQQPGAAYTPQVPAATYPTTTTPVTPLPTTTPPASYPSGYPSVYPPGASTTGNGSIGDNGAVPFQTTTTVPVSASSGDWITSDVSASRGSTTEIASVSTSETAWQNLETLRGTTTELTPEGEVRTTVAHPEAFVVSSSQMFTQVSDDTAAPAPVTAEPKTLYAGQYQ